MSRKIKYTAAAIAVLAAGIYINNTNLLAAHREGKPVLLAHRGIAQRFDERDLKNDTCTAARMLPPAHQYLENTIRSMRAGFAAGADIVEIDVHPTTDGEFAVFHDWTLDCRTDGQGVTREHAMADLKLLDIGHGYTADSGKTFPFRGKGIGQMPTLSEVLAAFPDQRLLINVKSRDRSEGEKLAAVLNELPAERRRRSWSMAATSRSNRAPARGRHQDDFAWRNQELPARLHRLRLERRGAESLPERDGDAAGQRRSVDVGLAGPFPQPHGGGQQRGLRARSLPWRRVLDRHRYAGAFARLPPNYSGGIWTNEIEAIVPLTRK